MNDIQEKTGNGEQTQILLMEDEDSVAKGLQMVLNEEGYEVDRAATGQGALDMLEQKEVDLLVADLRLPDMDGMEVVRRVKREKPETGVIVITGYSSVPSAVDAMKYGVSDYLPKPFTEEEFMERVGKALVQREESLRLAATEDADAVEAETEEPEGESLSEDETAGRPKILLIEDEYSVGQGLQMILDDAGYGSELVTTGKEALGRMDQEEFDVLVADLRLPDMDGMEVIRRFKEEKPHTEAVVITGYATLDSAVDAMKQGVVDYLPKPFTEEQFMMTVDGALERREKGERGEVRGIRTLQRPEREEPETKLQIGVYVCHGGTDIVEKVDVPEVVDFARRQPHVVVARDHEYLCREPGLAMIEEDIQKFGLNRVVVAACNPGAYEEAIRASCERAGLRPENLQIAPIREQVAWATEDRAEATRKARSLVAANLHRVKYQRTLTAREVSVSPDILIVGGGIAGMQAALDVAESGHKAYLVERDTTIGGHMLQFDKTFPTLDCAACIGTPKMVEVGQSQNIEVLTHSEVKSISGHAGKFKVTVHRKPRYVKEGVCTGCGECANVCPVEKLSEWDEGLSRRKAIYRSFPQAVPITFAIDKMDRAPCVITCPAGVSVQGYVQLIKQGKYKEAVQLIMERLPLPGVLGRVCPHPCESECRRLDVDEAVAIRELKRFAADQVDLNELPVPEIEDRPEKVAVVGSGPAGLTTAYYLRRKGYQVTLFEALEKLGGMLRVGIPDYRLPPAVLDREIDHLLKTGIEVRTGWALGTDFSLDDLRAEGFKAVFLGIGAHRGMKLNIEGEDDYEGVLDAVDFLRDVNLGRREPPGSKVIIIGGGNVAVDAARTALRLGSEEVTIVYRRTREEMPAYEEEIEEALEEGIKMHYLTAPVRIHGESGRCSGFECIGTELGEPDASGRRRPVPIEGSEFVIECDAVIPAIGQRTDLAWMEEGMGPETTRWGTFVVDPHTMQTSIPHVFASGDVVTGPATVIEAISSGHKAVEAIHRFILGEDLQSYAEALAQAEPPGKEWQDVPEGLARESRAAVSHRAIGERSGSFDEVSNGLSEEDAKKEAERCLNCGICCECMQCVQVCEANAIDHDMQPEDLEIEVGSIILATGYDLMDPTPMKEFGYGRYPNVMTSLEFERLNNATGPTGGQILLRDENGQFTEHPESVAIIHCVGSRDENYHEYCSRVCCMYALKYGHLIKDKVGHHTKIYDFYVDMRCFGKGYEEFYKRCQEEGILFFRGKPSEITDKAEKPREEGKLIVVGEDTLLNRNIRVPVDMVILCAAIEARKDTADVARLFGIRQGADGFFTESHNKLAPMSTAAAGIFMAGACQGPKDIPDSVAQASGAAAHALELVLKGTMELPATVAWIDQDACEGCLTCIRACEQGAIDFNAWDQVSTVNQAACNGCGACVSACPNGAAHLWQFREEQIFTEADGILEVAALGA